MEKEAILETFAISKIAARYLFSRDNVSEELNSEISEKQNHNLRIKTDDYTTGQFMKDVITRSRHCSVKEPHNMFASSKTLNLSSKACKN